MRLAWKRAERQVIREVRSRVKQKSCEEWRCERAKMCDQAHAAPVYPERPVPGTTADNRAVRLPRLPCRPILSPIRARQSEVPPISAHGKQARLRPLSREIRTRF